jgi:hypothetical protein
MKPLNYSLFTLFLFFMIAIVFSACRKNNDTTPDENEVVIPETTKIITQEIWNNNFIGFDSVNYTYSFSSDILSTVELNPGDVMVSSDGHGHLRKVTKVENAGNNVIVQTSFASLTDAIENGRITFSEVLTTSKISKVSYFKEGVHINTQEQNKSLSNDPLKVTLDTYLDDAKKVLVTGEFSVTLFPSCDFLIEERTIKHVMTEFKAVEEISISGDLKILDQSWKDEKKLAKVDFQPIVVLVLGMPVLIAPDLEIFVGADFNIQSGITTKIEQKLDFTARIEYEDEAWSKTKELVPGFGFDPPVLTASADAKIYIKPKLNLKIYGTVCPYLQGELYGRLDAELLRETSWSIYAGMNAGVGVEVEILGFGIFDYYTNPPLIVYEKLLAGTGQSGITPIIIDHFQYPGAEQPNGLTFANGKLWMSSYSTDPGIYEIDTSTGEMLNRYQLEDICVYKGYAGLAFDGTNLWHADAYCSVDLTKLNIPPTQILDQVSIDDQRLNDLAWDGEFLWSAGHLNKLRKIDVTSGQVVETIDVHGMPLAGLAYDGSNLWISHKDEIGILGDYAYPVFQFTIDEATRLESLAWDGTHLWAASFDQNKIYKIKLEYD